jgi:sugar O-acyltransferase (sialic acid O-acetyltransferase NeuD family)
METKELILIGGGGHCKSCIDVIQANGVYSILGILDLEENKGKDVMGYPIIGTNEDIPGFIEKQVSFLITVGSIGNQSKRIELFNLVRELGGKFASIVSPTAYVSATAVLGAGTIVMHQACINADAEIGCNCIINTKALIEHDARIGSHCHISTGAIVNGGTEVGENCFFGSGAVSKQYISIPAGSFIKANSIVKQASDL